MAIFDFGVDTDQTNPGSHPARSLSRPLEPET